MDGTGIDAVDAVLERLAAEAEEERLAREEADAKAEAAKAEAEAAASGGSNDSQVCVWQMHKCTK